MSIFKEMFFSIWNFQAYKKFIQNRKRKIFLYGIVLILLYFIISSIAFFIDFKIRFHSIHNIIENHIPEYSFENGKLHIDKKINYSDYKNYIAIDTNEDSGVYPEYSSEAMQNLLSSYSSVLIVDSDKMILKNGHEPVKYISFSEYKDKSFSKNDLDWKYIETIIKITIFISMIFIPIFMIISFFLSALIFSIIGIIISAIMGIKLRFGNIYTICIYSLTLPLFIRLIYIISPIYMPFGEIILLLINIILPTIYIFIILNMFAKELCHNNEYTVPEHRNVYSDKNTYIKNIYADKNTDIDNVYDADTSQPPLPKLMEPINNNYNEEEKKTTITQTTEALSRKSDTDNIKGMESKNIIPSDGWSFGKSDDE